MPDCGCGGGKKCITKGLAEQILGSFVRNNPQFNRKTKRATLMFIKKELKRLDCGCGCNGKKKFAQKYLTGGKLNDCPPGWRNDGLTCVEPCNSDEFDDGLTCRKKCTGEQIDDGLTCRNPIKSSMDPCPDGSRDVAGTCWGKVREDCAIDCFNKPARGGEVHTSCNPIRCNPVKTECNWGGWMNTVLNCRTTGGDCTGGDCRTWSDPIIPCGLSCWGVDGVTRGLAERNLKTWGGEVYGQAIRGKRITERIDWVATADELAKGFEAFMTGKLDYAALFDPEKNGVGEAFRKFGKDTDAAFNDIGKRFERAFDPNQNGVASAFAQLAREAEKNLDQFGKDFVEKCKDPDMWVQVITIMAQVAGAILAAAIVAGTLGAGTPLAIGLGMGLAAVGPAVKIIADAARNKPIDALDIAMLAIAVIPPVPGTGVVMGEGIRNAIRYGNYAAQAGRIIVAGVQAGQVLGLVPSTCIANCPPPPDIPPADLFEEDLDEARILALRPAEASDLWIWSADGSRKKNPNFISDDDWIRQYREANPSANASPETRNNFNNATSGNTAGEGEGDDGGIDFGGEEFGADGEPDFGGPEFGADGEPDFGAEVEGEPGAEVEGEPDFGGLELGAEPGAELGIEEVGVEAEGEPMTAEEFLSGTPATVTAQKKFMAKAEPKPLPRTAIPQKQTRFVEGISVDRTIEKMPKKEYRVSTAPSIPLPPASRVIIPTIPRGRYPTPKDERFYLLRGGFANMTQYVIRNNLYE